MPYLKLYGFAPGHCIEKIDITVKVDFSAEYYSSIKANEKLKKIQGDIDAVMEKYFPGEDFTSDSWFYNRKFNSYQAPD